MQIQYRLVIKVFTSFDFSHRITTYKTELASLQYLVFTGRGREERRHERDTRCNLKAVVFRMLLSLITQGFPEIHIREPLLGTYSSLVVISLKCR